MRFAPSNNPESKSSTEHVVLRYKTDAVVIPLPATYEDAVQEARNEFSLRESERITLKTRCLSGCEGLDVRINGKAWTTISHLVPQMDVFCELGNEEHDREADAPLPMVIDEGGPSDLSPKQKNLPSTSSDDPVPASAARRRPSVGPPSHRPRQSRVRAASIARSPQTSAPNDLPGVITQAYQFTRSTSQTVSSQQAASTSAKISRQLASQPASESKREPKHRAPLAQKEEEEGEANAAMEEAAIEEDELQEEEEEEEAPPPSPKKPSKRPRIDSDVESDGDNRGRTSRKPRLDQNGTASSKSSAFGTPKKAPPSTPAKTPKAKAPQSEEITFDIALQLWNAEDKEYEEDVMSFRTKPKHTVKKIIASAARSFEELEGVAVERLKLYLRRDGEDIVCELDQTMADLEIREDDQLVLFEEGPEDDEDEEQ